MVTILPGGPLATRPLHFFWVCDCSGSMSVHGKIQSLNNAIREAIPHMVMTAKENPHAGVWVRALRFSHSASWHVADPVNVSDFRWIDLQADALSQPKTEIVFLVDTSGSMNDEITAVKKSCMRFASKIIDAGADVKLGLVGFAIGGFRGKKSPDFSIRNLSHYTIGIWPLDSPQSFQTKSQALKLRMFGGTGCFLADKDTVDIFPHILKLYTASGEKQGHRILVIISDEIGDTSGLNKITDLLRSNHVKTYVMGVSKPGSVGAHELLAEQTGGKFWDVKKNKGKQDFNELLASVAGEIAQEITKTTSDGSVSKGTDMGKAMEMLADVFSIPPMPERALPPVIILISDGRPTDDFRSGLSSFLRQPWGRRSIRLAIAIGKDADHDPLKEFIGNPEIPVLQANNSEALINFMRWVSIAGISAASNSQVHQTKGCSTIRPDAGALQTVISANNGSSDDSQVNHELAIEIKEHKW